jgi:hypothetical protein
VRSLLIGLIVVSKIVGTNSVKCKRKLAEFCNEKIGAIVFIYPILYLVKAFSVEDPLILIRYSASIHHIFSVLYIQYSIWRTLMNTTFVRPRCIVFITIKTPCI